jgi:hypothetical protein
MRSDIQNIVLVSCLLFAMGGVSFSQRTDATFAGTVTDPTGAVLPGAEVQMINEGTAAVMTQITSETGEFLFGFLPAGVYTLKIIMPGFKGYESRSIPLGGAQNVRRTYILEVGSITDSVTVTGDAPLVNTISTEQRISVDTLEVKALPMMDRNITNILSVGSGLTRGRPTTDGMAGSRFRLNGLGGSSMSVSANGSDANGASGSPNISGYGGYNKIDVMSSESVAEVQVLKGVMPAEYGSAMGGHLSLITKSGTNEMHGSLFYRYEGSLLSARQPFLAREQNSVWNQYGGALGGPIKKDRVFFFAAYEGYRQRTTIASTPTVPTPLFRNILLTSLPFPETKLVLDYYPLPNQPYAEGDLLARWIGAGERKNDDDHVDFKIDYMVGGGTFSLSFTGSHPSQTKAQDQPLDPQVFTTSSQRAAATYVKGWGRWTSSTRAGYNRNWAERIDKFWYVRDPNKPETVPGWRRVKGISFPGLTGLRSENQTRGTAPSWQYEQQVAFFQGKHSLKFGALLSIPQGGRPGTDNGNASFQTLEDIQRNEMSAVSFGAGINPHIWRMTNFGFFVQDDWRTSRKLTLNLGLRYDRYGHYQVKPWHENLPASLPNFDGLLDAQRYIWGPLRPLDRPFDADPLSLGPRFGFAYTLDDNGDFVMRGGFGVNFQGFDAQTYEVSTGRTPYIPNSRPYTRAEIAARGLKYPNVYNEDLAKLVEAEGGGRPQIGNRWDPNSKPPYAMNYTLGFQRALTSTMMLETAYVGTRGVKFNMARTYNQLDRITGVRPNPDDQQGTYTDQSQQTNYNSWQTSLKQRLARGLSYSVNYTWGKALSYVGGDISPSFLGDTFGGIEDFNDVKIERTASGGDVTHQFVGNWVYNVPTPFANSAIARHILGGWGISGIYRAQTGEPLGVTQTGGRPDLLDMKGAVNKNCCSYGNLMYLNRAAFQELPVVRASNRTERRGHMANRALRAPGSWNLDISAGKSFSLAEGKSLEFKVDMLNAFNHVNYSGISTNMSAITFGQAISADPARAIQAQLRIGF